MDVNLRQLYVDILKRYLDREYYICKCNTCKRYTNRTTVLRKVARRKVEGYPLEYKKEGSKK
jgi:hypothetical protein